MTARVWSAPLSDAIFIGTIRQDDSVGQKVDATEDVLLALATWVADHHGGSYELPLVKGGHRSILSIHIIENEQEDAR